MMNSLFHARMAQKNKNMFAIKTPGSVFNYLNPNNQHEMTNSNILFLLSKSSKFPILEIMPKDFKISTNTNACHFNTHLLKKVSPIISNYIQTNPKENHYILDFADEKNVLVKIEQLFQGKPVIFEESEITICQYITTMLEITEVPSFLRTPTFKTNEASHQYNLSVNHQESNIKQAVQIQRDVFNHFLIKTAELKKFTIKTKKREYKCNIFAVYSSDVIRKILEKNPTINEYNFDFNDGFDEFQPICDLFNFDEVELNNTNALSIKEIADQLQIKCILNQVDDFITKYDIFSEKVDENQTIIESIDNLFNSIINIKKLGIEKVVVTIIQSNFIQTEESVQELAAFILQVVKPNVFIHKEIVELLIQLNNSSNENNRLDILIPFIVNNLLTFYMPCEEENNSNGDKPLNFVEAKSSKFLMSNYSKNYDSRFIFSFIRILYKRGFITREQINEKLQYFNYQNKNFIAFFLPEIIEFYQSSIETIIYKYNCNLGRFYTNKSIYSRNDDDFIIFMKKYFPNKIDLYNKMLDNMQPDDLLTKSIQIDDVDTLKSIVVENNIDVSKEIIPYNIFDDLDEKQTILNYSALYGSIKCFKYILLNGGLIEKTTLYFSVCGSNNEIIKIVNQKLNEEENQTQNFIIENNRMNFFNHIPGLKTRNINDTNNNNILDTRIIKVINNKRIYFFDYSDDINIIASAIFLHNNELFDWLFENLYLRKEKTEKDLNYLAILSASTGNAHSLVELMDRGYKNQLNIISKSAKNGFCKLTELILNIYGHKINSSLKFSSSSCIDFPKALEFGNLSIFKLLIQLMRQNDLEQFIIHSVEMKHNRIIEYYFDNYDKIGFVQTDSFLKSVLEGSFKWETNECFNFLLEKIKEINPNMDTMKLFVDLLKNSCSCCNLSTTKNITNFILKEDRTVDFTEAFLESCKSESFDICHYFIDEKVYLNYNEISTHANELGSIDVILFSTLIHESDLRVRFRFYRCISSAILCKNKELLDFLFKEKAPNNDELFEAVSTGDISMVDIVLKYNSQPSFINKKSINGTAILISYNEQYDDILKRLLSIKGIDPMLTDKSNNNCLSLALKKHDFTAIDLFLNHIGDKVQSQVWIIADSLKLILKNFVNHLENPEKRQNVSFEILWKIVIRLLSIKYIDPNISVQDHLTFLHVACIFNEIEVVKSLLKIEKIDVNQYESLNFNTPLITSLKNNSVKIAKIIIDDPRTDLNLSNIDGETALEIAVNNNLYEIIDLLIKNNKFDPIQSKLDYSFYCSDNISSEILISSDLLDINHRFDLSNNDNYDFETTSLIHSVEESYDKKVDLIINHPKFDKNESYLDTAIFIAAEKNNLNIFKKLIILIDNDVNIKNHLNKSLLSASIHNLSGSIIDYIFSISKFDSKSSMIFESFIELMNHDELNDTSQNKSRSLFKKNSVVEIMNKIYNYDQQHDRLINLKNLLPNGKTFFTIIQNNYDKIDQISDFLIQNGSDLNMPDKFNVYPLEHAIKLNSIKFIISLINSKQINLSQLPKGDSYLHIAVRFSDSTIFESFLNWNIIDINIANDKGNTPLIEASKLKKTSIINLLFKQKNLDYLHRNKKGKNALTVIKQIFFDEEKEVIKSKEKFQQAIINACLNCGRRYCENQIDFGHFNHVLDDSYPVSPNIHNINVQHDDETGDTDIVERTIIEPDVSSSDDDDEGIEIED